MSLYVPFEFEADSQLQESIPTILAIPAIPEEQNSKNSKNSNPDLQTPHSLCVACGQTDRWDDSGIWRCRQCWPEPLTQAARHAAEREQAHFVAQRQAQRTSASRPKPRDLRLGPVLPPCAACGELRHWHDHATKTWLCWTCTPPVFRKRDHVILVGLCEPLDAPVCQAPCQAPEGGDLDTTETTYKEWGQRVMTWTQAPEEVR
jgi:hypothetical protein